MRLAVIADIHGNLLALEAVMADLRRHAVDAVINLGDCVSGPLWPRETAQLLMSTGWPTIRGNHDRWVTDWPQDKLYPGDAYAFRELDQSQRDWLKSLPPTMTLGGGMLACHGSPEDDNAYLLESVEHGHLVLAPFEQLQQRLSGLEARVVLCAHSHLARQVTVGETVVVNPGSVGQPAYIDPSPPAHVAQSGSPLARYAVVTEDNGAVGVLHVAVPYDHRAAAARATSNGSKAFAHFLMTGFAPPRRTSTA